MQDAINLPSNGFCLRKRSPTQFGIPAAPWMGSINPVLSIISSRRQSPSFLPYEERKSVLGKSDGDWMQREGATMRQTKWKELSELL